MKVIAVFDIENDRIFDYSCDLHVWNEFGDVRLVKENASLKPLPQKMPRNELGNMSLYKSGWNACLDEITGETDERSNDVQEESKGKESLGE